MSDCRACCPVDVLVPNDLDYGFLVYATQDFSFVVDCPPGYYCQPGRFPVIITIGKGTVPPVQTPPGTGGTAVLMSCRGPITGIIPFGASLALIESVAAAMQHEWARRQANCDVIATLTPIPAGLKQTIGNDEQCFTTDNTTCPAGQVQREPITNCVPAGTFTEDLLQPTTSQIAAVKALLNLRAADLAKVNAQAFQECGWFNTNNVYVNGCACSPGCGFHGPYSWTWNGGEFFSQVALADANAIAACAACDQLYALCLADGCLAASCLTTRNACGPNPCP